MHRWTKHTLAATVAAGAVFINAAPAGACGGLIGRNGAVNLEQTTTLAAYHNGVEHYVTAFTFAGGEGEFGSIIPLPGVPTNVEKGGNWTLQRLEREVRPQVEAFAARAASGGAVTDKAEVILKTRIDALDVTVLRGGGAAVGQWATEHGFFLPPDAPEVLDFYAQRSPIFLAARFDATAARARGASAGDGTPVHVTIPTANPWVPLRILALGKQASDPITADVFLLNDHKPALLPAPDAPQGQPGSALRVDRSEFASARLLSDLRSDKGMEWVPPSMHLTFLRVAGPAGSLKHDLAIDVSGRDEPSPRLAGLKLASATFTPLTPEHGHRDHGGVGVVTWTAVVGAVALMVIALRNRGARAA